LSRPLKILVITYGYPSKDHPDNAPFVQKTASKLAETGAIVSVIHPVKFTLDNFHPLPYSTIETFGDNSIKVMRPRYFSFSDFRIRSWSSYDITLRNFERAVKQALKKNQENPDAIYAHFFFPSGLAAVHIGEEIQVPTFIGSGESYLERMHVHFKKYGDDLRKAKSIIAVSSQIKRFLVTKYSFFPDKVEILNNGVDLNRFKPVEKSIARENWRISENKFIIGYVGSFTQKKGVLRLIKAVEDMEDVSLVLIGDGPLKPQGKNIVFCGKLDQSKIPELLSTVDIFVLPTLGEGCCNAILEAFAIGLPVVSSDRDFNDDILNDDVSIRINSEDILAIRNAIITLKDNHQLRGKMSKCAILWAKKFDLNVRSKKIYSLIENSRTVSAEKM
jgi:teichuronic acid biosynthesis glycosyltransferase TuaC